MLIWSLTPTSFTTHTAYLPGSSWRWELHLFKVVKVQICSLQYLGTIADTFKMNVCICLCKMDFSCSFSLEDYSVVSHYISSSPLSFIPHWQHGNRALLHRLSYLYHCEALLYIRLVVWSRVKCFLLCHDFISSFLGKLLLDAVRFACNCSH